MEERIRSVLQRPDAALLSEIRSRRWTSHNIPLTAAESTLGREKALIGDDPRTIAIKRIVRTFGPSNRRIRILDLGALEGGLSFEMAREGWEAVGVEGRQENLEKAELIRRYFGLPNLRFELRDVKTLSRSRDGEFDAVLCCGLLYHLDDPFRFLRTIREITAPDGLLFIDTHVAPDQQPETHETWRGQLSGLVTISVGGHDYDGAWFSEPSGGSELDRQWSAISNERSFWPTRRSLIRALYHAGFHTIHELFGMFDIDGEFALRDRFSRTYMVGL